MSTDKTSGQRFVMDTILAGIKLPTAPKLPANDPALAHKTLKEYGRACAEAVSDAYSASFNAPRPGYAIVPIEPTPEMLQAGYWSGSGDVSINEQWARKEVWARMVHTYLRQEKEQSELEKNSSNEPSKSSIDQLYEALDALVCSMGPFLHGYCDEVQQAYRNASKALALVDRRGVRS